VTSSPDRASSPRKSVLVVGAGISGLACARSLLATGVSVRVVDRGRRPGGRMSGRTLHGRIVDLGASYFTVPEGSGFAAVVTGWEKKGLARPWTESFAVLGRDPIEDPEARRADRTAGTLRYAAPHGLRSLVIDLAEGVEVETGRTVEHVDDDGSVDGEFYDAVVLAMPEPQAARLLGVSSPLRAQLRPDAWDPVVAVALGYPRVLWPADLHGAFVHGSSVLTFLADDGDRRGDGAAVIVAHTSADFARDHLERPESAVDPVTAEVGAVLGLDPGIRPDWNHAHRWTSARTTAPHPEPFALSGTVGVCGDAWGGRSSVATAWQSGDALGQALALRR